MKASPLIAVTCGEPAGIGPEILAMLAQRQVDQRLPARVVLIGDRDLLTERAKRIGPAPTYADYDPVAFIPRGAIEVLHQPLVVPPIPGRPDPTNARSVLAKVVDQCRALVIDPGERQKDALVGDVLDEQRTFDRGGGIDAETVEDLAFWDDAGVEVFVLARQAAGAVDARAVFQI